MKELSGEAREVLERGLSDDGPSSERRERVKQQVLLALGSGAFAVGTAAAAGAAAPAVAGVGAGAKGALAHSLLLWFGMGAAAGIGVAGSVTVVSRLSTPEVVAPAAVQGPAQPAERQSPPAFAPAASPASAPEPAVAQPPERAPVVPAAPPVEAAQADLPSTAALPASPSALREEALLLQRAQRALAAGQPSAALEALAEHERRFASGSLREERQVARVLADCALGRVEEARILARAFAGSSASSVLIPRIQASCAGDVLNRR